MQFDKVPFEFDPNITYPAYLTRNRLLQNIVAHAPELTGSLMDFGCGQNLTDPYLKLINMLG
jgi:hypothetical protein